MIKLFNKPHWIKPELNELKYWLHLLIIAVIILGILQYLKGGEMLTIINILGSIPLLAVGDLIAHTILQLD